MLIYTYIFLLLQGNMFSNIITINTIDIKCVFNTLKNEKVKKRKKTHLKPGFIVVFFRWVL